MATIYTINVKNSSPYTQNFFFFQKPAEYVGGQQVYSNSIYYATLQPYGSSGSVLTFQIAQQYYAGAQTRKKDIVIGQASGFITATQPIDLTSADPSIVNNNSTQMTLQPTLGLAPATYSPGVQPGAYRVVTPSFDANNEFYNVGMAVSEPLTGTQVLSSFINAEPSKNIDCQPVLKFYVQTGDYKPGTVINFSISSSGSALCDATNGHNVFNVEYKSNGSWTVNSSANFLGQSHLLHAPQPIAPDAKVFPVQIKNEAGTEVICTGVAATLNAPFMVENLSHPVRIDIAAEYQIGPVGGPFRGYMCVNKEGNSAGFV